MNKISQNKDFELSFTKNAIVDQVNQEQKNYLECPEDKSFSDLNFTHLENTSKEFNYMIDNDSINSLEDDLHSSKKSELEYDLFSKNIVVEKIDHDMDKHLQNNIQFPFIKKNDIIEDSNNQIHLTTYGDYKDENEESEKNENEFTNQNSGTFNKIQNRKINKMRKKLKFLILEDQKQSKVVTQLEKEKEEESGKASDTQSIILKELFEKNLIKKYKYRCEHSGCTKTFRTLKLKLNRHDLSDSNCKKDTITLLYMVKNVKNLLKRKKRKNSTRINRLQKLYKKCIYSLPHRDYAINIAGNHLIN